MGIQNPKKLYRKFSVVPMWFSKWHIEWQTCKRDCTPHIMNIRMKIYSSYSSLKLLNEKYLFSLEKHINSFIPYFSGNQDLLFVSNIRIEIREYGIYACIILERIFYEHACIVLIEIWFSFLFSISPRL